MSKYFPTIPFNNALWVDNPENQQTAISQLQDGEQLMFELKDKAKISDDTFVFRFKFSPEDLKLGCEVGQHVCFKQPISNPDKNYEVENVFHSYTPISVDEQKGECELLMKVYYPNKEYPRGGRMSQYIDNMKFGDQIEVAKAGYGRVNFNNEGVIDIVQEEDEKNNQKAFHVNQKFKNLGLICCGSGITPILQIIRSCELNGLKDINLSLLYVNKTGKDILLRQELEQHQRNGVLKNLTFATTREEVVGAYHGRPDENLVKEVMPEASEDTMVLLCGSGSFTNHYSAICESQGHKLETNQLNYHPWQPSPEWVLQQEAIKNRELGINVETEEVEPEVEPEAKTEAHAKTSALTDISPFYFKLIDNQSQKNEQFVKFCTNLDYNFNTFNFLEQKVETDQSNFLCSFMKLKEEEELVQFAKNDVDNNSGFKIENSFISLLNKNSQSV